MRKLPTYLQERLSKKATETFKMVMGNPNDPNHKIIHARRNFG